MDQISDSCDSCHLTISIEKTEVVYQPAPGEPYKEPAITVKGQRLLMLDKFTYLENTLSGVVHIDDEINDRIANAGAAFGQLNTWKYLGSKLNKARQKAGSLQIYGAANTIKRMWNLTVY